MTTRCRRASAVIMVLTLAGCTSGPPEAPAPRGTLKVTVTELPDGTDGRIHVTGPRLDARVARDQELRELEPGRYVLDIEPVRVPDNATRHPVAAKVEVDVTAGGVASAEANYGVLVPDTTTVLDAANLGLVSDAEQAVLVFTPGSPAAALAPGRVLVTGIGPKTPQGLLRKVVAVRPAEDGVRVETEPATLVDAVPVGEITLRQQAFGSATLHNLRRGTATGTIDATFSFTKGSGTPCEGGLNGGIQLTWMPSVDLNWKWAKFLGVPTHLSKARFAVESPRGLAGTFTANADLSCVFEVSYPPVPYFVGSMVLMLGPVPVVLSATVQFISHSTLSAKANADYSFGNSESITLGVEYKNGKLDPFTKVERPDRGANATATLDLSSRVGVRFGLKAYALAGPYLDLTFGLRGRAEAGKSFALCTGFYGDMGWEFSALGLFDLSLQAPDIIKQERQQAPEVADRCPLSADPDAKKLLAHKTKPTLDDYRWMIGTWQRQIDDPSHAKEYLTRETLVIRADGQVSTLRENDVDLYRPDPIRCEGALAIDNRGVLVIDLSPGPAEYMEICHNTLDGHAITYEPSVPGGLAEHVDWFSVAERPFYRVK